MKKSGAFFWGLVIGSAAGALIGVLLAPDKGSVTREKLKQKAAGLKDSLEEALRTGEEVTGQFTEGTDEEADFEEKENQG